MEDLYEGEKSRDRRTHAPERARPSRFNRHNYITEGGQGTQVGHEKGNGADGSTSKTVAPNT